MTATLSQDIAARAYAALDAPDRDGIRALLAHVLAAAIGRKAPDHHVLVGAIAGDGPADEATRWAGRLYGRSQDDFYYRGRCHVAVMVLPGLLTLELDDILAPFAAGALAQMMVAAPYAEIAQRRGVRPTAFFGPVGSAVATSIALGLDVDATTHALTLALGRSGASAQCFLEHTGEMQHDVVVSAGAGVQSAFFAAAGVTGAAEVFEGPWGWAAAHFADPGAGRLRAALDDWSDGIRSIAVKPFAASGMIMPAIALADELGERTGRAPLTAARIHANPAMLTLPGTLDRSPLRSRVDAVTSVIRCVAEGYVLGTVTGSSPDSTPAVLDAERVIEVIADETLAPDAVRIEVDSAGTTSTAEGNAAEQLYPDWATTLASAETIARRSDADPARVAEILDVLAAPMISSAALREAVRGA